MSKYMRSCVRRDPSRACEAVSSMGVSFSESVAGSEYSADREDGPLADSDSDSSNNNHGALWPLKYLLRRTKSSRSQSPSRRMIPSSYWSSDDSSSTSESGVSDPSEIENRKTPLVSMFENSKPSSEIPAANSTSEAKSSEASPEPPLANSNTMKIKNTSSPTAKLRNSLAAVCKKKFDTYSRSRKGSYQVGVVEDGESMAQVMASPKQAMSPMTTNAGPTPALPSIDEGRMPEGMTIIADTESDWAKSPDWADSMGSTSLRRITRLDQSRSESTIVAEKYLIHHDALFNKLTRTPQHLDMVLERQDSGEEIVFDDELAVGVDVDGEKPESLWNNQSLWERWLPFRERVATKSTGRQSRTSLESGDEINASAAAGAAVKKGVTDSTQQTFPIQPYKLFTLGAVTNNERRRALSTKDKGAAAVHQNSATIAEPLFPNSSGAASKMDELASCNQISLQCSPETKTISSFSSKGISAIRERDHSSVAEAISQLENELEISKREMITKYNTLRNKSPSHRSRSPKKGAGFRRNIFDDSSEQAQLCLSDAVRHVAGKQTGKGETGEIELMMIAPITSGVNAENSPDHCSPEKERLPLIRRYKRASAIAQDKTPPTKPGTSSKKRRPSPVKTSFTKLQQRADISKLKQPANLVTGSHEQKQKQELLLRASNCGDLSLSPCPARAVRFDDVPIQGEQLPQEDAPVDRASKHHKSPTDPQVFSTNLRNHSRNDSHVNVASVVLTAPIKISGMENGGGIEVRRGGSSVADIISPLTAQPKSAADLYDSEGNKHETETATSEKPLAGKLTELLSPRRYSRKSPPPPPPPPPPVSNSDTIAKKRSLPRKSAWLSRARFRSGTNYSFRRSRPMSPPAEKQIPCARSSRSHLSETSEDEICASGLKLISKNRVHAGSPTVEVVTWQVEHITTIAGKPGENGPSVGPSTCRSVATEDTHTLVPNQSCMRPLFQAKSIPVDDRDDVPTGQETEASALQFFPTVDFNTLRKELAEIDSADEGRDPPPMSRESANGIDELSVQQASPRSGNRVTFSRDTKTPPPRVTTSSDPSGDPNNGHFIQPLDPPTRSETAKTSPRSWTSTTTDGSKPLQEVFTPFGFFSAASSLASPPSPLSSVEKQVARRLINDLKLLSLIDEKRRRMGLLEDRDLELATKMLLSHADDLQNRRWRRHETESRDEGAGGCFSGAADHFLSFFNCAGSPGV